MSREIAVNRIGPRSERHTDLLGFFPGEITAIFATVFFTASSMRKFVLDGPGVLHAEDDLSGSRCELLRLVYELACDDLDCLRRRGREPGAEGNRDQMDAYRGGKGDTNDQGDASGMSGPSVMGDAHTFYAEFSPRGHEFFFAYGALKRRVRRALGEDRVVVTVTRNLARR